MIVVTTRTVNKIDGANQIFKFHKHKFKGWMKKVNKIFQDCHLIILLINFSKRYRIQTIINSVSLVRKLRTITNHLTLLIANCFKGNLIKTD